jgi:hypothetical protein
MAITSGMRDFLDTLDSETSTRAWLFDLAQLHNGHACRFCDRRVWAQANASKQDDQP